MTTPIHDALNGSTPPPLPATDAPLRDIYARLGGGRGALPQRAARRCRLLPEHRHARRGRLARPIRSLRTARRLAVARRRLPAGGRPRGRSEDRSRSDRGRDRSAHAHL